MWCDPGNQVHGFADGADVVQRNLVGGFNSGGVSAISLVKTGSFVGIYDLRIYAGTPAAPGALLGEWPLDGSGTAS